MLNILNCFLGCHLHRNNRNIVHLSNTHPVPIFSHTSPVRVIHFTAPLGNNRLKKCSNVIHRVSNRTPPRSTIEAYAFNLLHLQFLPKQTLFKCTDNYHTHTHTRKDVVICTHEKENLVHFLVLKRGIPSKKKSNHPHADILQA